MGATDPYEANRTLRLLSKMFKLAQNWNYLDHSDSNPTKRIIATECKQWPQAFALIIAIIFLLLAFF